MERVRRTLITLVCFLLCGHRKTFGTEVKIKLKPGDNVTVFGDCVVPVGSHIFWIRNNSYGNQSISLFAEDLFQGTFPRFHFVANSSSNSFDLHIKNASVYDEGLYYCAKVERKITDVNDKVNIKLEYQYGNRRTHLSLLEPVPSESTHPEVSELRCNCWMLLLSVCSVCVLLSSLLSAACVYCLCRTQTTGGSDRETSV
ncbi:uncharacterized protein LOC130553599 isoform X2 [Triplophysa rosa]|uniref:uncharacterized protein LOC130553599 isoform X2 n=1 Tax=Triplophysa rosa TaxID=992332 RepID=UPI0025462414|nr:uncharacterized protein LOC130553599 isoform X2 [Triplophysa rosa]